MTRTTSIPPQMPAGLRVAVDATDQDLRTVIDAAQESLHLLNKATTWRAVMHEAKGTASVSFHANGTEGTPPRAFLIHEGLGGPYVVLEIRRPPAFDGTEAETIHLFVSNRNQTAGAHPLAPRHGDGNRLRDLADLALARAALKFAVRVIELGLNGFSPDPAKLAALTERMRQAAALAVTMVDPAEQLGFGLVFAACNEHRASAYAVHPYENPSPMTDILTDEQRAYVQGDMPPCLVVSGYPSHIRIEPVTCSARCDDPVDHLRALSLFPGIGA